MAEDPYYTVICVDFGMTGSATTWRNNRHNTAWNFCPGPTKIPTELSMDTNNNSVLAWGESVTPDHHNVHRYFKSNLNPSAPEILRHLAPESPERIQEFTHHFLAQLCCHVIRHINTQTLGYYDLGDWKLANMNWCFTFPSSWENSVTRNFKQIASSAVMSCFEVELHRNLKIFVDVTEGKASGTSCLIGGFSTLNRRLEERQLLLSCDIGGATTDIALLHLDHKCDLRVRPQKSHKVMGMGVANIDEALFQLIQSELKAAGYHDFATPGKEIINNGWFTRVKHEFHCGSSSQDSFSFNIPVPATKSLLDNHHRVHAGPTGDCSISEGKLVISRRGFASGFEHYLKELQEAIDDVIDSQRKAGWKVDVIALSGGGSRSPWISQRLRQRYESGDTIVLDQTHLTVFPELAAVDGCSKLWDYKMMSNYVATTSFRLHRTDGVVCWMKAEAIAGGNTLDYPVQWVVSFAITTSEENMTAEVIAIPRQCSHETIGNLPRKFQEAREIPGSQLWDVELEEVKSKGGKSEIRRLLSRKRHFKLLCTVTSPGNCKFSIDSEGGGGFRVAGYEKK